jgi:hypothetical protein
MAVNPETAMRLIWGLKSHGSTQYISGGLYASSRAEGPRRRKEDFQ